MRLTHPNKVKGNNFEREIVNLAKSIGLDAKRAYASDGRSLGEVKEVDVIIDGVRVQAKRRRQLPEYLKIDEGVDLVVFREDRGETYALVRWDKILELLNEKKWKP